MACSNKFCKNLVKLRRQICSKLEHPKKITRKSYNEFFILNQKVAPLNFEPRTYSIQT